MQAFEQDYTFNSAGDYQMKDFKNIRKLKISYAIKSIQSRTQ